MSRFFATLTIAAAIACNVFATPLPSKVGTFVADYLIRRQAITPLPAAQVSSFKPFTFFASAAYCHANVTIDWSCGGNVYSN